MPELVLDEQGRAPRLVIENYEGGLRMRDQFTGTWVRMVDSSFEEIRRARHALRPLQPGAARRGG